MKKNTRGYVKNNPDVKLQGDLPPKGRHNWYVKNNGAHKAIDPLDRIAPNGHPQASVGEKSSYKTSRFASELFDDHFFDTPELLHRDRPFHHELAHEEFTLADKVIQDVYNPFASDALMQVHHESLII